MPGNVLPHPRSLSEIKEDASGRWHAIFESLAPALAEAMSKAPRHVHCPVHGGTDGYRLFRHYNESGQSVCNTCGVHRSGLDTLVWANGCSFRDAVLELTAWLYGGQNFVPKKVASVCAPVVQDWAQARSRT